MMLSFWYTNLNGSKRSLYHLGTGTFVVFQRRPWMGEDSMWTHFKNEINASSVKLRAIKLIWKSTLPPSRTQAIICVVPLHTLTTTLHPLLNKRNNIYTYTDEHEYWYTVIQKKSSICSEPNEPITNAEVPRWTATESLWRRKGYALLSPEPI